MSGGSGYGQQQQPWGGQTGGNMYGYGGGLSPNAGQGGGMGSQPFGMGAPSPMDSAFSPTRTGATEGWGGGGLEGLRTGQYPGSAPPLRPLDGIGSPWGGQTGGNMGDPMPLQALDDGRSGGNMVGSRPRMGGDNFDWRQLEAEMRARDKFNMVGQPASWSGGAMGKMGGGIGQSPGMGAMTGRWDGPVAGDPTRGMGGGMGGAMPQPTGDRYQDYANRRRSWIDELRGYVAQPTPWGKLPPRAGGAPMPNPGPVSPGGPPTSAPPGGPYPGAPKAGGAGTGGVDHMANMRALMAEDPSGRLAAEYRTRSGDTIDWWQKNQGNVASGLFGGNPQAMQNWIRDTSAISSNSAPLSYAEMARLNDMAGIRGPSFVR